MKKIVTAYSFVLMLFVGITAFSFPMVAPEDSTIVLDDSDYDPEAIEATFSYQTGTITLKEGNGKLIVPKGFKYLDPKQAIYVLSDLWGNPVDSSVLGLLVPENIGVTDPDSWVFTIKYDGMGYVKDDDANDINYDDLLKDMQKEVEEANPARVQEGYQAIQLVGWASTPYYDKDKKVLHWAKELKFGSDSLNTLNYNLRILGRKGVYVLNAIATMSQLEEVKANINPVLGSVEFEKGNSYFDFDPKIDEVAAWTLGSLVAGKVLAKVGFFALILKFWKFIAIGFVAAGSWIWNLIKGRKEEKPVVSVARDENKEEPGTEA